MLEKKDIGSALKSRMELLDKTPSSLVWSNIEKELDDKGNKKGFFHFWSTYKGVLFLLFGVFVVGISIYGYISLGDKKIRRSNIIETKQMSIIATDSNTQTNVSTDTVFFSKHNKKHHKRVKNKDIHIFKQKSNSNKTKDAIENKVNASNLTKAPLISNVQGVSAIQNLDSSHTNKNLRLNTEENSIFTYIQPEGLGLKVISPIKALNLSVNTSKTNFAIWPINSQIKEVIVKPQKVNKDGHLSLLVNGGALFANTFKKGTVLDTLLLMDEAQHKRTFSYGIGIQYLFKNNMRIGTGLNVMTFENTTINVENTVFINSPFLQIDNYDFLFDMNTSLPFALGPFKVKHKSQYLEWPLEIGYVLKRGVFDFTPTISISAMFLNGNDLFVNNTEKIGHLSNLNNMAYTISLGIEMGVALNDNIYFNVQGHFKRPMFIYNDTRTPNAPYFISTYTGLRYQF